MCVPESTSGHSFMAYVGAHPAFTDRMEKWLLGITSGQGNKKARDAAFKLACRLNTTGRLYFCVYAYRHMSIGNIHPAVFGAALEAAWTSGNLGNAFSEWCPRPIYRHIVNMFEHAGIENMTAAPGDKALFDTLPDEVTIYRGTSGISVGKARYGMSWTTDLGCAMWFATRWGEDTRDPVCLKGAIQKDSILAAFNSRNEKEIVVPSGRVRQVKKVSIDRRLANTWKKANHESSMAMLKAA